MPTYRITAPDGRRFRVTGDSPPSEAELESIFSSLGGQTRRPARSEDFTDARPEPEGSAAGRFLGGVGEMLNPVTMAQGLYGAVRHPLDTAGAMLSAQGAQFSKAKDAYDEGRYSEMLGHGAAGLLPVVGPVAAGIGEEIGAGDVAGGLGKAAGLLGPIAGGRAAIAKADQLGAKAGAAARAAIDPGALVSDAVRFGLRNGVPVDAATATGNRVVRGAKDLADRTLGGAVTGTKAQRMRAESMAKLGKNLAGRAAKDAATPETAGAGLRGAVEDVIKGEAAKADDAYARVRRAESQAQPDDVPVSRPVSSGRTVDQGFIGHWLADDLNEMGYQAGGVTKAMARDAEENFRPGDAQGSRYGIGQGAARVAGTPTQEMFHKAGVSGSRTEIADKVRRYLRGESNNPRVAGVIDAMREAWDGQRFDFDLVSDDALARTGMRRRDFKSPVTLPNEDAPGAALFFGADAGLPASGTEPMQFAVPLAGAKDALRPVLDRLNRKRELTGTLMGDEGRAAVALDALVSGPDHASLSTVDAALGDLKAAARGAAMPDLRTAGQGLAAQAVKELEQRVESVARDRGVWDDLRAGRDATIAKWTAAETLDALRAEPVQTFRALTQSGDAAVDKLRAVKKLAPGEMGKIGRAYLEDALDVATAEGGFGREAKLWADWQKLGDETKALIFPDTSLRTELDQFFLLGKKMAENSNPSGSGYTAGLGAQGTLLLFEPATGAATAIAGGVLSKALNSPKVAKLLTQAMQTPRTATAARSIAARLKVALRGLPAVAAGTRQEPATPAPRIAASTR